MGENLSANDYIETKATKKMFQEDVSGILYDYIKKYNLERKENVPSITTSVIVLILKIVLSYILK